MTSPSVIHKKDTKVFKNSLKCTAYGYSHNDKDIDVAYVEIKGRYPDFGTVTNEKVKEIIFVVKGSGKLVIDKKIHKIKEGTAALLLPNQEYYYKGKMSIIASCTPAWTPEQHKQRQ